MNTETRWRSMTSREPFDVETCRVPIKVGSSLWFAQINTKSEESRGMLEYHLASDTFAELIYYPTAFKNIRREGKTIASCKYKEDCIVVICWIAGCGFVFDTKTRRFSNPFSFQSDKTELGASVHVSCVAIGDYIHIFHAFPTRWGNIDYTICSMIDKTSRCFTGPHLAPSLQNTGGSDVIKIDECYQSANKMLISGFIRIQTGNHSPEVIVDLISNFAIFELFKFGGYSANEGRCCSNSFYIGTLKDGDPAKPIEWKVAPQYKSRHDTPLWRFGYIQHGPFIVKFGGNIIQSPYYGKGADSIDILDLRQDCGWIETPIKCPQKGQCIAALDNCGRVHLWYQWQSCISESETHHCIQLSEVLPLLTR